MKMLFSGVAVTVAAVYRWAVEEVDGEPRWSSKLGPVSDYLGGPHGSFGGPCLGVPGKSSAAP